MTGFMDKIRQENESKIEKVSEGVIEVREYL